MFIIESQSHMCNTISCIYNKHNIVKPNLFHMNSKHVKYILSSYVKRTHNASNSVAVIRDILLSRDLHDYTIFNKYEIDTILYLLCTE